MESKKSVSNCRAVSAEACKLLAIMPWYRTASTVLFLALGAKGARVRAGGGESTDEAHGAARVRAIEGREESIIWR
jgi:hypothetical protein